MKYAEDSIKLITALGSYIILLATPEKIIVALLFMLIACSFIFSVWAYFEIQKRLKCEQKDRELFEKRFLLTEIRADLLIAKHAERHPEDGNEFYTEERKLIKQRFEELKKWQLCGSSGNHDND